MDILKLLSRSTKQTTRTRKDAPSTKLPSAGTSANPQLFYDAIPEARGKKRKRGRETEQVQAQDEAESNVNFFEEKASVSKEKKSPAPKLATKSESKTDIVAELLDEGECRQLLRSHRLKATLLPSNKPAKVIKKSKKKKKAVESTKKEEYKQIYPQPLVAFKDLRSTYGISGRMAENLVQQGYKIPTEVQMGSLPLLLRPKIALGESINEVEDANGEIHVDLLAVAPTGSGKTLAFLIPIVDQIMQRRRASEAKEHVLEAIVVAPTKELATQIVNEAKKLSPGTGVKVVGMRKGMRITKEDDQEQDESSGDEGEDEEDDDGEDAEKPRKRTSQPAVKADIMVSTPGLLFSALSTDLAQPASLPTTRTLVLDEADVLLDPLFRDQTLGVWNSCTNPELRVTLWSATMGSNIESLASSTIQSRRSRLDLAPTSHIIRLVVGLKDSAIPNITHRLVYAATEPGKLIALRQLLHPTAKSTDATQSLRPPFLVFTQTIPRAVALHSELLYDIPSEAGGSTRIAVLHAELSDTARSTIMTRFRNGEIWILITTDILSRGVDFRGINGVVNYDVPNSGAAYIHRVGRTGRAGREGGVAVTFYTKEDIPYVKAVANIIAASEKAAGKGESEAGMKRWLLDALPTPSKQEKKKLKLHGVEARRGGLGEKNKEGNVKGKWKSQISTKSGYERKLEHNRKGAIQGSRRRMLEAEKEEQNGEDSEWGGIDE
ncbi:P-loop containing nucleoside triphosphate hydrolase protein [Mollisia scopiformis]|uniref:ATP-dependent RNA helicase n=1 Tax=Mollisia scopiformis TaxID=149040 RepID=A0A132B8G7_MOLSC|nr:P-loop containing nucleoside triphosphate hydrolase protein [Mollisia scopiformis]KUJ08695.1 P-loop containing nucleoside triphosphate hydrolase protein [Mollisia scopiformis]